MNLAKVNLGEKVDKFFKQWDRLDTPGCAFAIIKDSKIVYKKNYGMADLEHDVPITPQTVWFIGSISKQFTAMCILLLTEQNKISLDDDVRKYLPEFPDYGQTVTIHHLIHHTSGIRDYCGLVKAKWMSPPEMTNLSMHEVLQIIYTQKELNFPPGEMQRYSNSGYVMLAAIVEKVAGKSLGEFAEEHIFNPLGMKNTCYIDDNKYIIKNRALGYISDGKKGYHNATVNHRHCGPGGVYSTVEDLFLWDQNYYKNKLGKKRQDLIKTMQSPFILNNGETTNYAFGLNVLKYKGQKLIFHGGGLPGYHAIYFSFPKYDFSVIILANNPYITPGPFMLKIVDIYFEQILIPEQHKISVDPVIFQNIKGKYYSEIHGLASISCKNHDMIIQIPLPGFDISLIAESETSFSLWFPNSSWITFQKDDYSEFTFYLWGNGSKMKRLDSSKLLQEESEEYVGGYYSEEIDRTYYLTKKNTKLIIQQNSFNILNCEMVFAEEDLFLTDFEVYKFKRNNNGNIVGFNLNRPLVRNLWFQRI